MNLGNRLVFPAPPSSYGAKSYRRHLCWVPWHSVISPDRVAGESTSGIPCIWMPAPKAAMVLLYFHANAEDLGMTFKMLRHMRDQFKVNIMAVEYPGYGLLQHLEATEEGVLEVALTVFRYLVDEVKVSYPQIIICGRSLGSGPSVHLAAQFPIAGLILVSAFESIKAAIRSIAGPAVAWAFAERFQNEKLIHNVSCPTLFIHGEKDKIIPVEQSIALFQKCRSRKLLVMPPNMDHNSSLFSDVNFFASPTIHFFGLPGYCTTTPPRLPACVFDGPKVVSKPERSFFSLGEDWITRPARMKSMKDFGLCDCLSKSDGQIQDFLDQEKTLADGPVHYNDMEGVTVTATSPLRSQDAESGREREGRESCRLPL